MGPLFSAGLIVVTALIAWIVLFSVARIFMPTREAVPFAVVLVVSGATGAGVAVLALSPFFAGETLTTTTAVLGYLGAVASITILFAVAGAAAYRKWSRQSNRTVETDARKSGARGSL